MTQYFDWTRIESSQAQEEKVEKEPSIMFSFDAVYGDKVN